MALSASNLISSTAFQTTTDNSSAITSGSVAVQVGDVLVCKVCSEDSANVPGTPTNTGTALTWTLRADTGAVASHEYAKIYTAVATVAESITVSCPVSGTASKAARLNVWRGAQLAATPATNSTKTGNSSAPSASVATAAAGSAVDWVKGDWNTTSGTNTYLSSAVAEGQVLSGGNIEATFAHQFAGAAGAQTIGLSAPGGQNWAMLGIEIQEAPTSVPKSGSDSGVGSASGSVAATISGGDSGTGSESGFVAQLKSGSDSGTGTESGFAAQLNNGGDSGAGSESGSMSASTSGGDSGTGGSSTVSLAASTSGSDAGLGSESGYITLPGSDTATGAAALVELNVTTSGGDSGVGSEGGYVEELFGQLVVGLWAIHPTTGEALILPDFTKVDLSRERNGAGSITVEYPSTGRNFDILRGTLTDDRDLEIEVWTIGSKVGALRGFLQEAAGDDVAEGGTWTFVGGFGELLLNEAEAWPAPIITTTTVTTTTQLSEDPPSYQVKVTTTVSSSAGGPPSTSTVTTTEDSGTEGTTTESKSTNGDLVFEAVTPGELANLLLDQAQDRGDLGVANMERGFTDTHDSAGVAWPKVISSKFSPGSSYDSILGRLVDFGVAEWGVTWTGSAYRLDLWVIFGRGVDKTVGLRPIILRKGRNLVDAPRKWSVRDSGTALLAAGAEGVYEEATDVDAEARRGRRIERFASANNLEDHEALQGFAQNQLVYTASGQLEVTHGIAFAPGEPRPVIAYDIGDWVYSQTTAGLERLRVVQWTLSFDAGSAAGTTTLNDFVTDALSRLKAQIDNLISGDTVVGTSEGSGGQDRSTPLPPDVVSADSIAFLDGTLGVRAAVTVALQMPVLNVDGTVITDMDSVVVQYALASSPDVWNAGITKRAPTESATFTAPAGQTINIRSAVVDRQGNISVWSDPPFSITTSDDDIPPPIPSTPTVSEFLGTIRINWDQLTAASANMLDIVDFDHVELHLSTSSLFTPSQATLVGEVRAKQTFTVTDLPYGVTQFARLVAVDWSGNKSDPSGQGSATPAQIVNIDVGPDAIDRTQIIDGEIVNALIANATIQDAKIANLNVGKLVSGTGTFDMILSGSIKTATSGNRTEMDNAGIRLYNGTNIVVDFKTSNGSALVVGEFRTALSGQRVVFNPSGSLPDQLNFYPSAAGDFARIMSRTSPGDGTAAVLIDGGAANGTARGRLGAYKGEAFVSHVKNDTGGDTSAGFSTTALSCTPTRINVWVTDQLYFWKINGTSGAQISGSLMGLFWANGDAGTGATPTISANNAGIKFDVDFVCVTTGTGNAFGAIKATAFTVTSGQDAKTAIEPVRAALPAVRAAQGRTFLYREEVERRGKKARRRYGVLAEEMPADLVMQSPAADGSGPEKSLNLADWLGLVHAAVAELADSTDARLDALEQQIRDQKKPTP